MLAVIHAVRPAAQVACYYFKAIGLTFMHSIRIIPSADSISICRWPMAQKNGRRTYFLRHNQETASES